MIYFCLQRTRECQFVFLFLGHAGKHGQGNLPDGESPKLSFSRKNCQSTQFDIIQNVDHMPLIKDRRSCVNVRLTSEGFADFREKDSRRLDGQCTNRCPRM